MTIITTRTTDGARATRCHASNRVTPQTASRLRPRHASNRGHASNRAAAREVLGFTPGAGTQPPLRRAAALPGLLARVIALGVASAVGFTLFGGFGRFGGEFSGGHLFQARQFFGNQGVVFGLMALLVFFARTAGAVVVAARCSVAFPCGFESHTLRLTRSDHALRDFRSRARNSVPAYGRSRSPLPPAGLRRALCCRRSLASVASHRVTSHAVWRLSRALSLRGGSSTSWKRRT